MNERDESILPFQKFARESGRPGKSINRLLYTLMSYALQGAIDEPIEAAKQEYGSNLAYDQALLLKIVDDASGRIAELNRELVSCGALEVSCSTYFDDHLMKLKSQNPGVRDENLIRRRLHSKYELVFTYVTAVLAANETIHQAGERAIIHEPHQPYEDSDINVTFPIPDNYFTYFNFAQAAFETLNPSSIIPMSVMDVMSYHYGPRLRKVEQQKTGYLPNFATAVNH